MLCLFALIIVSNISCACDNEIEHTKNQGTKQISYLKETLPHFIRDPFLTTIHHARPYHTRNDLDFINWAVDCVPFVDWQAWHEILNDYQNYLMTQSINIIHPPFLFQALCSRSTHKQRNELLNMLLKLPQHIPSSLVALMPNHIIRELSPQFQSTKNMYEALHCIVKQDKSGDAKRVLLGEIGLNEAWKTFMKKQWGDHEQSIQTSKK